jgi:hypothetical protein
MRLVLMALILASLGCGPDNRGNGNPIGDAPEPDTPPQPQDPCEAQGKPRTTISGTILAPNGTLPLYGVTVYVPEEDPGPLPDGLQCTRCTDPLPGGAVSKATTNEYGRFTLEAPPSGTDIPLVVTVGKWRRQLVLPVVNACADNPVDPALTRLPKNKTEGDIPKIAMVTGNCDALECLIRKLGIDLSEFTNDTGTGRVHLYASNGANRLLDNSMLAPMSSLWGSLDKLKQYDIAVFSCECSTRSTEKPLAMMENVKAYADAGGRIFLSHYHYVWLVGANATQAPPVWPSIAACNLSGTNNGTAMIDTQNNPKGPSFSLWMQYTMGSPAPGAVPIMEGTRSCASIDNAKAERWVFFPSGATQYPMNFQFSTPNEEPVKNERCGKVVFSDMHVSAASSSSSGTPFPNGCSTLPLTSQEQALAFMFFDIATCVGIIQ